MIGASLSGSFLAEEDLYPASYAKPTPHKLGLLAYKITKRVKSLFANALK
jgi:hypothetical protein